MGEWAKDRAIVCAPRVRHGRAPSCAPCRHALRLVINLFRENRGEEVGTGRYRR